MEENAPTRLLLVLPHAAFHRFYLCLLSEQCGQPFLRNLLLVSYRDRIHTLGRIKQ